MKVVTIGETMVSMSAKTSGLMRYVHNFDAKVAGAESNVVIGLARLGHETGWISRLGDDEFGHKIASFITGEKVDTSQVQFDEKALTGIYFKEKLTNKKFRVHYYRKHSAASHLQPNDINEEYLAKADYLHITGITPALSKSCHQTILKAINIAKKHDVTVVLDPNIRKNLWPEEEAREVLMAIAKEVDILLPGIFEARILLGDDKDSETEELAKQLHGQTGATIVMKLGESGAYVAADETNTYVQGYPIDEVTDPIGAGDAFAAGFLAGLIDGKSLEESAQYGNAAGAMVVMVSGDVEGFPDKKRLHDFINGFATDDVGR